MMINKRATIAWLSTALVATLSGIGQAQYQTRDGALLGGVAGAVIGGVVGHQKHETGEGALIGGVAGAVTGGLIGNYRDQQAGQRYYYQPQPHYQPQPQYQVVQPAYPVYRTYQPVPTTVVRRPVSAPEVINMTRSGVSDAVIIAHIQTNGLLRQPDANEVIMLSREGVSDQVITAMQQLGANRVYTAQAPTYVSPSYPNNVIVREETIYSGPVYSTPSYPVYQTYRRYPSHDRRGF